MRFAIVAAISAGVLFTIPSAGAIIDHGDIDAVGSLPQTTMDAIGQQKWFFSHASVGGNMISGMKSLRTADPTRYQLQVSSVGYSSSLQQANNPPSPTVNGRIYDCSRGNPGWQSKFTIFDRSVRNAGWRVPAVDVVMDKLCYIDEAASATTYVDTLAAIEADHPDTVVVYITMPLTTGEDSANVLRNRYNEAVRTYCEEHGKLLYDLADMEAHDPSGHPSTFTSGGKTYQKLYSGYTSDGGHLNSTGGQRIAMGWYAVAAVIAAPPVQGDFTGDGQVDKADLERFLASVSGPAIPHDGSADSLKADFDGDNDVDQDDFGRFQRNLE
ncbi:MAG TPA: SGNH/GDSL hydrolase family protein [Phycisphaerae bacterium]|nr:SGNH/GDSL hydrolase family protein [Phycisphaerae bacterium]HRY67955.1 SGNH/GDSL hydrolase family protein [Phycisphaerae bacterium]HSA26692.1 SGNH/GDSL hydrolase family protein [Phycisphaerae bacterium]